MKATGVGNSSIEIEIMSDIFQEYYGPKYSTLVSGVRHNGGGYMDVNMAPEGTEVLGRFLNQKGKNSSSAGFYGQPGIWAYKESPESGRLVVTGSHPEDAPSGDILNMTASMFRYAWDGSKSFETDGPCRDFRVLGALYAETVQLITMKEDIKTVADLKGRSVSIGAPGSGVYFNAMDVLEGAGLTVNDIKPQYQSFDDSKEALKDGQIDAAFIVAGAPTSAITELATTNGVFLVPIDGELRDKIMSICPYYAPMEIPADTENAKGAELSVENATSGIVVPFHAGAAKYFAEHGVTVETAD